MFPPGSVTKEPSAIPKLEVGRVETPWSGKAIAFDHSAHCLGALPFSSEVYADFRRVECYIHVNREARVSFASLSYSKFFRAVLISLA